MKKSLFAITIVCAGYSFRETRVARNTIITFVRDNWKTFNPDHTENVMAIYDNICGWPQMHKYAEDRWNLSRFIAERPELFEGLMPYDEATATKAFYNKVENIMYEFEKFHGYNSFLNYEQYHYIMQVMDRHGISTTFLERDAIFSLQFIRCNPNLLGILDLEINSGIYMSQRHSLLQQITSLALKFSDSDISREEADALWLDFVQNDFDSTRAAINSLCPSDCSFRDFLKDYLKYFYGLKNGNLDHFDEDCSQLRNEINFILGPFFKEELIQTIVTFEQLLLINKGLNILLQGLKILSNAHADQFDFLEQDCLIRNLIRHLHYLVKNPNFVPEKTIRHTKVLNELIDASSFLTSLD